MHTLIIWMWLRSELATRIHTPLEWESVHTRYYLKSFFPTPKDGSVVLGGFLSTFSIHFSIPASTLLVMISEMHGLAFFRSLSDAMTSLLFSSFSFQEKKPISGFQILNFEGAFSAIHCGRCQSDCCCSAATQTLTDSMSLSWWRVLQSHCGLILFLFLLRFSDRCSILFFCANFDPRKKPPILSSLHIAAVPGECSISRPGA